MSEQSPGQRESLCQQHLLAGCGAGMQVESLSGTRSLPAGTVGYTQVSCLSHIRVSRLCWSCSRQEQSGRSVALQPLGWPRGCLLQQRPHRKERESLGNVPPPGGSGALGSQGFPAVGGAGG